MENTIRRIAEIVREKYVDEKLANETADKILDFLNGQAFQRYLKNNDVNRLLWGLNCVLNTTTDDGHFFISRSTPGAMNSIMNSTGVSRFTPHYIRFTSIADFSNPVTRAEVSAILAQVQDPLLIDLRDCPGGSPESAYFILSHFFPDDVPLFEVLIRGKPPRMFKSTSRIPFYSTFNQIKKYNGKIKVLVNTGTASAAENIAFVIKNRKRGTIYGSRTGAYGHATMMSDMDGLFVRIPYAKTVDPDTHQDWEKDGVEPDHDITSKEYINLIFNEYAEQTFTPSQIKQKSDNN